MAKMNTSEFRSGAKILVDGQPYIMVNNQFVKPGKGQAFNRTKLKHLLTGRVIEKTFKSGESVEVADVSEASMRLLYRDGNDVVFMDDDSYEQINIAVDKIQDVEQWLMEDIVYEVVFYNGEPVTVEPPMFLEMKIVETAPGVRGDTASGRVLKSAVTESGGKIQIPIFIGEGEVVRIDTRTGEYVSRVTK
jgi:elongation factor P